MSSDQKVKDLDQLMAAGGAGFEDEHTKKIKKFLDKWECKDQATKEDQAQKTAYEKTIAGDDFEKASAARAERAYRS